MRALASFCLGLAVVLGPAAPALAQTPTLKPEAVITTEVVRIADLVENAGRFGDVAVFRAPDLGHTGQVPVWRIVEATARAGLDGLETRGKSEVIVVRQARVVPLADMEERIAQALSATLGVDDPTRIAITFDRGVRPIAVEPAARGELVVTRMDHDPRSGRFDASLDVVNSLAGRRTNGFRVTGSAAEMVEFLAPSRPIARGETLRAGDFTVERRLRTEMTGVTRDMLTAFSQAAGQAARRPLAPGRPIRPADLMKPELVERNGNVLIIYEMPGFTLSIRGRALETGAEGDVIQVQNLQTRKVLQATVMGLNRVLVTSRTGFTALSQAPASPQ